MNYFIRNRFLFFAILFIGLGGTLEGQQSSSDITIQPIYPTNNCPNGGLNLVIGGGIGPYSVDWYWEISSGSFLIEGNDSLPGNNGIEDLENIPPGEYRVDITDAACGQASVSVELLQAPFSSGAERIITERGNISDCSEMGGSMDGRITVLEVLGLSSSSYTVSWSGPGINGSTTGVSISGLGPGDYTMTITTTDGCELSKTVTLCCCDSGVTKSGEKVDQCGNQGIIFPISIEQVLLYSPDDRESYNGQIQIKVQGGSDTENSISWTGPDGFTSTNTNLYNLGVGEYCVTVSDGCSDAKRCFELVDCSERPMEVLAAINNSCVSRGGFDVNAGVIALNIQGGWPPFEYRWDDGNRQGVRQSLPAGRYCVTISDSKGCRPESACFTINYNPLVAQAATGNRCGQAWFCNGTEFTPDFQPVETFWVYDDSKDCRVRHEYCPFNTPARRMPTAPKVDDLTNLRWDRYSCNVIGTCPAGVGIRIEAYGTQRRLWTTFTQPNVALRCFKLDICEAIVRGERAIRLIDQDWVPTNLTPQTSLTPCSSGSGCLLTCSGVDVVQSNGEGEICANKCAKKHDKELVDMYIEYVNDLTVAEFILIDYNEGNDVFSTTYSFAGDATLASTIGSLPSFSDLTASITEVKGFTLEDLYAARDQSKYYNLNGADGQGVFSSDITVHPNPTNGKFWINFDKSIKIDESPIRVEVYNLIGKKVTLQTYQSNEFPLSLDITGYPPGMYILKLSLGDSTSILKKVTLTE
jgi:hypothetical protein